MNKTNIILIVIILILLGFSYRTHSEIKSLKEYSEACAKENETLKMDLDVLKKRLNKQLLEMQSANKAQKNVELDQKFNSMKNEIDKLRQQNAKHKTQEYREREEKIWEDWSTVIKQVWGPELSKKLGGFDFSEQEITTSIEEYNKMVDNSRDIFLSWYRNEINEEEAAEKAVDIAREFFDELSDSVGAQKASIALSVIFPDLNFRQMMFTIDR